MFSDNENHKRRNPGSRHERSPDPEWSEGQLKDNDERERGGETNHNRSVGPRASKYEGAMKKDNPSKEIKRKS